MAQGRSFGRGRRGVGSNQYKDQRPVSDFEFDPDAARSYAASTRTIRFINRALVNIFGDRHDGQRQALVREMFPPEGISAGTDLPNDVSERLASACANLYIKRGDMSIPQNAANAGSRTVATSIAKAISTSLDDPQRVTLAKATGIKRKLYTSNEWVTVDGTPHSAQRRAVDTLPDEEQYVVVVTDRNRENPHVIDATIARLAPVRNKNIPVEERLGDSGNPFSDFPLVMSLDDYQHNVHFDWDSMERV